MVESDLDTVAVIRHDETLIGVGEKTYFKKSTYLPIWEIVKTLKGNVLSKVATLLDEAAKNAGFVSLEKGIHFANKEDISEVEEILKKVRTLLG